MSKKYSIEVVNLYVGEKCSCLLNGARGASQHASGFYFGLQVYTDVGVDDAWALMITLAQPQVEVLAITTVHGNAPVDQVTRKQPRSSSTPDLKTFGCCPGKPASSILTSGKIMIY